MQRGLLLMITAVFAAAGVLAAVAARRHQRQAAARAVAAREREEALIRTVEQLSAAGDQRHGLRAVLASGPALARPVGAARRALIAQRRLDRRFYSLGPLPVREDLADVLAQPRRDDVRLLCALGDAPELAGLPAERRLDLCPDERLRDLPGFKVLDGALTYACLAGQALLRPP